MAVKKRSLALGVALLLSINQVYGVWNPESLVQRSQINGNNVTLVSTKNYLDFKNQILNYLENSWCSKEKASLIMDLIVLEQPRTCVEIGVFTGSSLLPIASALKYINYGTVYAIDAWSSDEAIKYMSDQDPNKSWWSTVDMNVVYYSFQQMLKNWDIASYSTVISKSSENAVSQIGTIDFLHMDGNYTEEGSCKDVMLYLPKVKKGGYILFSNLFLTINNNQPKMKAFVELLDHCEIICEIEHNNCVLLQKLLE